jgi:hypothetical protein
MLVVRYSDNKLKVNEMAKTTLATIKSFIKKNSNNLYLMRYHKFDSSYDGIRLDPNPAFEQVTYNPVSDSHRLGIDGAWFTYGGNNFTPYDDGVYKGFNVYNCCVNFVIAIK